MKNPSHAKITQDNKRIQLDPINLPRNKVLEVIKEEEAIQNEKWLTERKYPWNVTV